MADRPTPETSMKWKIEVNGVAAELRKDGDGYVIAVAGGTLRVPGDAVLLLHSLCHLAMDHHVEEHSSCHDRKSE